MCDSAHTDNSYETSAPNTTQQGCATGLVAALDPRMDAHAGKYLDDCAVGKPYAYAADPEVAEELWRISERLVGHRFEEPWGVAEGGDEVKVGLSQ